MSWGTKEKFRRTQVRECVYIQNLVPQRDRNQGIVATTQCVTGAPVSRVLAQDTIARLQKHIGDEGQRLLGTIGNDYLMFFAANAPRGP
ncbi:hypothetical protein MAALD49_20710 [Marinobacter shengliensis]|nr:hypothetical protein MAALD49_20710 [Marinobacter shengliensis]